MSLKSIRFNLWSMTRLRNDRKTETRRLLKGDKPRYQVGDVLWVREAFRVDASPCGIGYHYGLDYEAKGCLPVATFNCTTRDFEEWDLAEEFRDSFLRMDEDRLIPNLFMPKWACREWLEVTEVRRERLRDITENGAVAEGCDPYAQISAVKEYSEVWDSINKKPGTRWTDNPEVEVICFKRVGKPEGWPNV